MDVSLALFCHHGFRVDVESWKFVEVVARILNQFLDQVINIGTPVDDAWHFIWSNWYLIICAKYDFWIKFCDFRWIQEYFKNILIISISS